MSGMDVPGGHEPAPGGQQPAPGGFDTAPGGFAAAPWRYDTDPGGFGPVPGGPGGRRRGLPWRRVLVMGVIIVLSAALGGGVVAATRGRTADASAPPGGPVASSSAAPAAATTGTVQAALAAIEPSVVDVTTTVGGGFGGSGAGTGIIIGASGEVITNAHVVDGASSVRVQVPGHGTVNATVVAANSAGDLALLRLQGLSGLAAAKFAATSTVHVGDAVLAVGNAEGYGGAPTVTEGIISALNRDLPGDNGTLHGLLQTDAAINPGNSGGALVDTAGRVVGVTTAVATGQRGAPAQNIGFAIPTDTVLKALPDLRAGHSSAGNGSNPGNTGGAFLGVGLADSGQGSGAVVTSVAPGTPADRAGLQPGDVIVTADGSSIGSPADLRAAIARHKPGDRIRLTWQRNGQTRSATVTLASRPAGTG